MDKQEQLKVEIRLLLNMTISNLQPRISSAESKGLDDRSLESGLSAIGLELEHAENLIADYWYEYEKKGQAATVSYPQRYNLQSDAERRQDANDTARLIPLTPSRTMQRELHKRIVHILLESRVSLETLKKIESEIDSSEGISAEFMAVASDFNLGLVDAITAANLRGYDGEKTVEAAKKDHAERLNRIAISQSPGGGLGATADARGVGDLSATKDGSKIEKQPPADTRAAPKDSNRGGDQGKRKPKR